MNLLIVDFDRCDSTKFEKETKLFRNSYLSLFLNLRVWDAGGSKKRFLSRLVKGKRIFEFFMMKQRCSIEK